MPTHIDSLHVAPASAGRIASVQSLALSPTQQSIFERLEELLRVSPVVGLVGPAGCGRTTIAHALARRYAGRVLDMSDVFAAAEPHDGFKWEEAVAAMVMGALDCADCVVIDDYTPLGSMSNQSSIRRTFFPRLVAKQLSTAAADAGKRLVLVGPPLTAWETVAEIFGEQAAVVTVPAFKSADYAAIVGNLLGAESVAGVDFKLIHRYASMLQGHQLRLTCELLANEKPLSAEKFIECIETYVLDSNLRLHEVEELRLDSLPGAEEIIQTLETHVVLPFENRQLAQEMGLKPKRGVLLYGPPGTGKTSIGRAVAHRMRGKFFLIDGSFVSEPPARFFTDLTRVVEEAKENSPSVLFIDDVDVLFTIEHIAGLERYLLSLLDGLESKTATDVCVMMTAADVRKIPEALLRSGRVELWLQTKPPTEDARGRILQRWMGADLPEHDAVDYSALARATVGFTPADLRRIANDAKALYAADVVAKRKVTNAKSYLDRAVDELTGVRNSMENHLLRRGAGRGDSARP